MASGKRLISTDDVDLGDPVTMSLNLDDPLENLAIVTEDTMKTKHVAEYAQELAFMEEKVTFSVSKSELPNAVDPVECSVNGEKRRFYRGVTYQDCRKFINALINVTYDVNTVNNVDPKTGLQATQIKRDPFQSISVNVTSDPAGQRGMNWLAYKMNGDRVVGH
jgi:hypothetical protein